MYFQCFAEKQARNEVPLDILECQVNPAAWEISGHIVLKRKEDFEFVTQDSVWRLLSQVSLSKEAFAVVKQICLDEAEKSVEDQLPSILKMLKSSTIVQHVPSDSDDSLEDFKENTDQEVPFYQ